MDNKTALFYRVVRHVQTGHRRRHDRPRAPQCETDGNNECDIQSSKACSPRSSLARRSAILASSPAPDPSNLRFAAQLRAGPQTAHRRTPTPQWRGKWRSLHKMRRPRRPNSSCLARHAGQHSCRFRKAACPIVLTGTPAMLRVLTEGAPAPGIDLRPGRKDIVNAVLGPMKDNRRGELRYERGCSFESPNPEQGSRDQLARPARS